MKSSCSDTEIGSEISVSVYMDTGSNQAIMPIDSAMKQFMLREADC